jgi:anaerobic glycerol-3-phosphate dehydrogenase
MYKDWKESNLVMNK